VTEQKRESMENYVQALKTSFTHVTSTHISLVKAVTYRKSEGSVIFSVPGQEVELELLTSSTNKG
jgi:hypothetical protein